MNKRTGWFVVFFVVLLVIAAFCSAAAAQSHNDHWGFRVVAGQVERHYFLTRKGDYCPFDRYGHPFAVQTLESMAYSGQIPFPPEEHQLALAVWDRAVAGEPLEMVKTSSGQWVFKDKVGLYDMETSAVPAIESPTGKPVFYGQEVRVYPFLENPMVSGYSYGLRGLEVSDMATESLWQAFGEEFFPVGHVRALGDRVSGAGLGYSSYMGLNRVYEEVRFTVPMTRSASVWFAIITAKPVDTLEIIDIRGPNLKEVLGAGALAAGALYTSRQSRDARSNRTKLWWDLGTGFLAGLADYLVSQQTTLTLTAQKIRVNIEFVNAFTTDILPASGVTQDYYFIKQGLVVLRRDRMTGAFRRISLDAALAEAMKQVRAEFEEKNTSRYRLDLRLAEILELKRQGKRLTVTQEQILVVAQDIGQIRGEISDQIADQEVLKALLEEAERKEKEK